MESVKDILPEWLAEQPIHACVKSVDDLRIISMTQSAAESVGYKSWEETVGLTDFEWRAPMVRFAEKFRANDRYMLHHNINTRYFSSLIYTNGERKTFVGQRQLLKNNRGENIGIFLECIPVDIQTHSDCIALLLQETERFRHRRGEFNFIIDGHLPKKYDLTPTELACLFYLIHKNTVREVGVKLALPKDALALLMNNLMRKMRCETLGTLVDMAIDLGFDTVYPSSLLPAVKK